MRPVVVFFAGLALVLLFLVGQVLAGEQALRDEFDRPGLEEVQP